MWIYPVTKTTHIGTQFQANSFLDPESAEMFCHYNIAKAERCKQSGKMTDGVDFWYSKMLLENPIGIPYGYRYRINVTVHTNDDGKKYWSTQAELLDRCESRFDCIQCVNLKKEESSFSFETMSQYEIHSCNRSMYPNSITYSDKMLHQLVLNMLIELNYIKFPEPEMTSFEIKGGAL